MRLALELARQGRGSVEPNPMVGAVIVRDGREIARGWHRRFGGPHAEAEALAAARSGGADVRGATLYVTLEPCCHTRKKTPPCAQAIVREGLARVVVAMEDPDSNVSGRGIALLRQAGIAVDVGAEEAQARAMLAPYVKLRTHARPWVICKWAQTRDGYLSLPPEQGRWLSCEQSRQSVHELRGRCDAILVGIGTVLADDPLLNNRSGAGRQPVRIVLDADLRLPLDSQLARSARQWPLLVVTASGQASGQASKAQALRAAGAELLELPACQGLLDLPALLDHLGARPFTYLIVEGGAKVLESFLAAGLADEAMVFVCPRVVGSGHGELPRFDWAEVVARRSPRQVRQAASGADTLIHAWL